MSQDNFIDTDSLNGKRVFKYEIPQNKFDDKIQIYMPVRAEILTAQVLNGILCIWALVNPEATKQTRKFRLAGTGHPIEEDNLKYISTFQMQDGNGIFVGHIFEIL